MLTRFWSVIIAFFVLAGVTRQAVAGIGGYSFTSTLQSYVPLSGTTTQVLNPGDVNVLSSAQPIGFTFRYDGQSYTQFKVSSNGFISLNTAQTSSINSNSLATTPLVLAPLWDFLSVDATGKVHYQLSGSAPNRVLTIEFKDLRWTVVAGSPNANFQVRLKEGSDVIEFRYGVFGTPSSGSASIGISDRLANSTAAGYSASHFLSITPGTPGTVSSEVENQAVSALPDYGSGTVYTFTPPTPVGGGLLTIGQAGTYQTIREAFSDLRDRGVSGPVTLEIRSDYLPESPAGGITIDHIPGTSAVNTVTLRPAPGVSKTVSIPNSAATDFTLRLRGVRYLTIDGSPGSLTFRNTGTNASSAVKVLDGVQNCTLYRLVLEAEGSAIPASNAVVFFGSQNLSNNFNEPNSNNTLRSCTIRMASLRCANGIQMAASSGSPLNDGNRIDSCSVSDWGVATTSLQAGIVLGRGYSNTLVADNEVFMTTAVPSYATQAVNLIGILASDPTASFSILRNRIHDITPNPAVTASFLRGIRIFENAASPASTVAQNMVTLDATATSVIGSGYLYGITDESSGSTNYLYNSVRIGGAQSSGSGVTAAFFRTGDGTTLVLNNVFSNRRTNSGASTGKHYAVRRTSASGFILSNYNDLFVDGVGGYVGYTSSDKLTLSIWQAATLQDSSSVSINPTFVSATDLHLQPASPLESRGTPVVGVATDYDGQLRHGTWPDVGADEFTGPAPGAFSLITPGNGSTAQPVTGSLAWGVSSGAVAYDVYLDTNVTPTTIVSSQQKGASYSYGGLLAGKTYRWKVRAKNASGEVEGASSPFSFATSQVPVAPGALSVTSLGTTTLTLAWTDNDTAEAGYRVFRSTSAGGPFVQLGGDLPANTQTYGDAGLTPNAHYYYRVAAFNAQGQSNYATRDTTTLAATPGTPTLASVSYTTLKVVIDTAGNPTVTQFAVSEAVTGLFVQSNGSLGASPAWRTYTEWGRSLGTQVTGLSRSTGYSFRVKSRNGNLIESVYGGSSAATTLTPVAAYPYFAGFEGTSDSGWSSEPFYLLGVPGINDWARGTFTKLSGVYSGTKAWVTKLSGNYSQNHNASLVSPEFNFSGFTQPATISFYHNFLTEAGVDAGILEYTTDGGASWTLLGTLNDPNGTNWYNNGAAGGAIPPPSWSGSSSGWKKVTYSSALLMGQPVIRFRFRFVSDYITSNSGWAIDNFSIIAPPVKDIQVVSVSVSEPRMVGYPAVISARIRNRGMESNPASVPLTYKQSTAPTSYGDPGGVSQTFSPVWTGDSATVVFSVPKTPSATGSLKMYVRSFYSGDGAPANDTANTTVTVNTAGLYFSEGFESGTFPPAGWNVIDANADGFTWYRGTVAPYAGSGHATYSYNSSNVFVGADDWLFTMPLNLDAGLAYTLSFRHRVKSSFYPERLKVTIGALPQPASQTTELLDLPNITNTTYQEASRAFAVPSTGTYYISFHCYSLPYEWDLYLDAVQLSVTSNSDLALTSLVQTDGKAPPVILSKSGIRLFGAADPGNAPHFETLKPETPGVPVPASPKVVNSALAFPAGNGSPLVKQMDALNQFFSPSGVPSTVGLDAAVMNVGSNDVAGYGINWTVDGVPQTPYAGGAIPRFTGVDTATLSYTPTARGTFLTRAASVLAADTKPSNDSATTRLKVYPEVAFTLKDDLGNDAAQFRVGYDREPGKSLTAGVRYQASQNMKLANVDAFYANKNSSGDTYQSQDSVWVRVWAAGLTDSAPGAVLYSKKFAGANYITTNPSGESFSLPLGADAPAFAESTKFWVSVTFDTLIRYPMGADVKASTQSYVSSDKGATWSPFAGNIGGIPYTPSSWWLRLVSAPLGSIAGTKYNDLNGNGVRDAGEPGIQGWTINLSGPASGTAITDTGGHYLFSNLEGGTYTVTEGSQAGWVRTAPGAPGSHVVPLTSGTPITGKDFGNFHLGSISGAKFNDLNGNGVKDGGEPGLQGWRIRLYRGGAIADSVLTDASGNYSFGALTVGTYTVSEAPQSGWLQTYPPSQGSHQVTITSGTVSTGKDFGNFQSSGIAGVKFHDLNANGARDIGEPGLQGWKVILWVSDIHRDSVLTDAAGAYSFIGLSPDTFKLTEEPQAGWIQSHPSGDGSHRVVLTAGSSSSNVDFGNYRNGSIAGTSFNDLNGNGVKDAGEAGLSGRKIRVTGTATDSALTDGSGNYSFPSLKPGSYTVSEDLPSGWGRSLPASPGTHSVTLTSNGALTGKNFATYQFSTISGLKFNDVNGNGVKDAGDGGVSGWLIRLSGAQSASQNTDTTGAYTFTNLKPGTYTISEETRTTWAQTWPGAPGTHTLTITGNSAITGRDFGNFQRGTIAGRAFNDLDADGVQDTNEAGLSSWLIRLALGGAQVESVYTNGTGDYLFTGLGAGSYAVSEALQAGWTQSAPGAPGTYGVTMTSGAALTGKNFGNFQRGTISGTKFNDVNANGVKEVGEAGLAGWRIRLSLGGVQVDSALTDSAGNYTFSNLLPATYTVGELQQTGWVQSYPSSPGTHLVSVTGGLSVTGKDFGNSQRGSISGTKFHDLNGNGVKDAGEPGLTSWRIRLFQNGVAIDSALTDGSGNYGFINLPVGTYTVGEAMQAGWIQSAPASPGTHTVVVTSGGGLSGKDFGNYQYGSIAGSKFEDVNGNGVKDAGEPVLSGWWIRLYRNGILRDSLLTDGTGAYTFPNLIPASYTVGEAVQAGWKQTLPASPGTYSIVITSGLNSTGSVFGNFRLGSIAGKKFEDLNNNGVLDDGEPGVQGWRVRLSLGGAQVDSLLTDVNGDYTFQGVFQGAYTVSEESRAGWFQTLPAAPGTYVSTINSGTVVTGRNFGNARYTKIAGVKFNDLNGNGARDGGEPVLAGWVIRLFHNSTQVDSQITDVAGHYLFSGIQPGNYELREATQPGWTQTLPALPSGYSLTLVSGDSLGGKDFGNYQYGIISGVKFDDVTGGGVKGAGTPGIPGWKIRLYRNGLPTDSALTAADGSYSFDSLLAGTYTIEENPGTGWQQTYPSAPGTWTVGVTSGTSAPDRDFGNFHLGTISGRKFVDVNADGSRGVSEPGLPNWRIRLLQGESIVDSTLTDGNGDYSFTLLQAGTYTVSEAPQGGWYQSMPASPGTYTSVITSGVTDTARDFGNYQLGSISGMKFNDVDGNGAKDGGEPGLSGWQIRITGRSESSTLTDGSGSFTFGDLVPGTYVLSEVSQAGWTQSYPVGPATHTVNLGSGQAIAAQDFGNFRDGSVSGTMFDDVNADGVRNAGEPPLTGWGVQLMLADVHLDTVLTDGSGHYAFTGLTAGAYTISGLTQTGWVQTLPASQGSYEVNITSGLNLTGRDFGNNRYSTVSGTKYNDLNGNGTRDVGEAGISNWRIRLSKNGVQVDSTLTDGSGTYAFPNVISGTYTVSEAARTGWIRTSSPATHTVVLTGGSLVTGLDFGNFEMGTIAGTAYDDANQNGARDGGEPGLRNWRMRLSKDGSPADSVLTDSTGAYAFTNLQAGSYTVAEQLRLGWVQTSSPTTHAVGITGGTVATGKDFGNYRTDSTLGLELELTVLIEGLYDNGSNTMVPDTVVIELRGASSPFALVDTSKVSLNENGQATGIFHAAVNGTPYYIAIRHRNALETWSGTPQTFEGSWLQYDFTTAAAKAYGSNVIRKGSRWCLYSGDCAKDGWVDASDMNLVDNDAAAFAYGYNVSDLNGDGWTDGLDMNFIDNNSARFIYAVTPATAANTSSVKASQKQKTSN